MADGEAQKTEPTSVGAKGKGLSEDEGIAARLIRLAKNADLFHTPDGRCFASFDVDKPKRHRETHPITKGAFGKWLMGEYWRTYGKAANGAALENALIVLQSKAEYDGKEEEVHVRIAGHGDAVFLDLCNDRWQTLKITATGWQLENKPPVRFRRGKAAAELPCPAPGGSINDLRRLLHLASEDDFILVVGWLIGALRPKGPYPVLEVHGQHGTAKSSQCERLVNLVDPAVPTLRAAPSTERDLAIAAANRWVVGLDNLSGISAPISDGLCRLSTGGGFGTRKLYADDEEMLFTATRPILMNGIDELATRSDLLDRTILVTLPVITENKTKEEYDSLFAELRPGILGALAKGVSAALKNRPTLKMKNLPRMSDFIMWVTAAEPGLGWVRGTYLRVFNANRKAAHARALEGNLVGQLVQRLMADTFSWRGTATNLLTALEDLRIGNPPVYGSLPTMPNLLSQALNRIAPNLRPVGIEVKLGGREGREGTRIIQILRIPVSGVSTVSMTTEPQAEITETT